LRKTALGAVRAGLSAIVAISLDFLHGMAASRPIDCRFSVANSQPLGANAASSAAFQLKEGIMKKLMIAAGAASLLALSSLAALADEAQGSITSIDTSAMTVTLDDGSTYTLPASVDAASLKVGEKVKIEFNKDSSGNMTVTAVTPAAS
jgi:hypothetical protein